MKKSLFFAAAAAALAFSACTNEEEATNNIENSEAAIGFSAYAGRTTRAAAEEVITGLPALAANGGFGIYAFEQGSTPWSTYRASNTFPNFFHNQHIEPDDLTGATWHYTPVKYWSNNIGAKHSFFAYAPYKEQIKAVFALSNNGPAIRYNAADDYDLMWGAKTGTSPAVANIDLPKPDVTSKVQFTFKHALSKVDFKVSYFNDEVHGSDHTEGQGFIDANTTIVVRSVKFVGNIPSQGLLSLYDGTWTYEATEEGAYEIIPESELKFVGGTDNANVYKDLVSNKMVIPTGSTLGGVQIKIVYDVITTDATNPKNNSTVTNIITSDAATPYTLEAGKAYTFKLDLGITSVKFEAAVDAWDVQEPENVDLPNNLNP